MERLTIRDVDGNVHSTRIGYYDIIEKLAAYEEAEEQGLLVKLPCKVGDKVWTKYGYSFEVEKVEIIKGGKIYRCGNQGTSDYMAFYEHEIGTDVFLTKE